MKAQRVGHDNADEQGLPIGSTESEMTHPIGRRIATHDDQDQMNDTMQTATFSSEIPESETHQPPKSGPDEVEKMECGGYEPGERKDATNVPTSNIKRHDTRKGKKIHRENRGSREDTKEAGSWQEESAPTQTDTQSLLVTKSTSPKRTKLNAERSGAQTQDRNGNRVRNMFKNCKITATPLSARAKNGGKL